MKKLTYFPDANCLSYVENASDKIDSMPLVANTAKTFAKPAGARFVRLSCSQLFYYSTNGTAAIAAADTPTTGSVSVAATVRPCFCVDDVASISVIAPAAAVVSAEWWG